MLWYKCKGAKSFRMPIWKSFHFFGSTNLTVDVDLKVIVGWVEEEKLLGMQENYQTGFLLGRIVQITLEWIQRN